MEEQDSPQIEGMEHVEDMETDVGEQDMDLDSESGNPGPFVCDHPGCGKSFKKVGKLNRHMVSHSGEVCSFVCGFKEVECTQPCPC